MDSARNAVYTLYKQTEIEVHHLPSADSSKAPVRITRAKDICRHANMICPNTTLLQPSDFAITSMTPVSASESKNIHLVAVTSKGVRLYFTTQRGGWRGGFDLSAGRAPSTDPAAPTCLELIYVRPPPPAGQTQSHEGGMAVHQQQMQQQQQHSMQSHIQSTTDFAPYQPLISDVHQAYYADGLFLAAGQYSLEPTGSVDCLLCTTRAIPSGHQMRAGTQTGQMTVGSGVSFSGVGAAGAAGSGTGGVVGMGNADLADTATDVLVQGLTWAIAEVPRRITTPADAERLHPLARQMLRRPRVMLVLTSSGLFVLTEQRPIDTLKALLEVGGTIYDQTVHEFFKKYGQGQSCAMSLAIASRNSLLAVAPECHLSATLPISASSETEEDADNPKVLSADVVSHAWRIFFDLGGHPRYEPPPYPSQPASDGKVTLSGRHDGLAIYLSQLLRPFWREKITKKQVIPGEGERQVPNVPASSLVGPQRELRSLQKFLTQNAQLFGLGAAAGAGAAASGGAGPASRAAGALVGRAGGEGDQVAFKTEQDSLDALRSLLSRTLEALSFVLLLIDYRMSSLVHRCQPQIQASLLELTFADLVTSKQGRDTARVLVETVIDAQISAQVSIDAVADVLQERCGSFCNADDVRLYKALECIRRAKESHDALTRSDSLRESVRLLNRATVNLPIDKLEGICKDYRELSYVSGAIELPLRCATTWDRDMLAPSFRADGMPENDGRRKVYDLSMRCYHLVLETLESFDAKVTQAQEKQQQQRLQQSEAQSRHDLHDLHELEDRRQNAYDQAQASTDALFHVAMYDWLLSRNKTDELLRMRTPYLEDYLRSEPITLERCLLLCMWYVSVGQNFSAAQLYAGLAQSTELDITLDDRIEYLSKASSNAKSAFVNSIDLVQFTTDIDEKLEVAQVQVEVFRAVQESEAIEEEQKVQLLQELDGQLLDISALYKDFAEPFSMHEIKLLIFHVSDHRDLDLIRQAWDALLTEAHGEEETAASKNGGGKQFERVASVVVELGRRFYPSPVAFPVDVLCDMLARYALAECTQQDIPQGWALTTLLLAGVPAEVVFDVVVDALETRREPFQTMQGYLFLVADAARLIDSWTREVLGLATDPFEPSTSTEVVLRGGRDSLMMANASSTIGGFPARRIDDVLSALIGHLTSLTTGPLPSTSGGRGRDVESILALLKSTQELIRRSF